MKKIVNLDLKCFLFFSLHLVILGFLIITTGAIVLDSSVFGSDGILSELGVQCIGNETDVLDCSVTQYSPMMCSLFQQAAVLCQGIHTLTKSLRYFTHCRLLLLG